MKTRLNRGVRFMITVALILICIVLLKFIIFPPFKEIPVTGPYQIESEDYWIDENTEDPYLSDGSLRQLQVRKWKAADCREKHPVIVASHGSCGTIDNNVSLYRELASHGYTVLAVAHPGQAAKITYRNKKSAGPSGKFMKQMTGLNPEKNPEQAYELFQEWMKIRVADINAVMDDYEAKTGKTDFIVLGHSLGGSAAYAMARIRDDVTGCIALESPFMYDIQGVKNGKFVFDESDYKVPLLNIYSDSSYPYLKVWDQYGNNARFLDSGNKNYTNIYYPGVGHMGLCDLSLASPVLSRLFSGTSQKVKAKDQLEKINRDCLSWLKQFD